MLIPGKVNHTALHRNNQKSTLTAIHRADNTNTMRASAVFWLHHNIRYCFAVARDAALQWSLWQNWMKNCAQKTQCADIWMSYIHNLPVSSSTVRNQLKLNQFGKNSAFIVSRRALRSCREIMVLSVYWYSVIVV